MVEAENSKNRWNQQAIVQSSKERTKQSIGKWSTSLPCTQFVGHETVFVFVFIRSPFIMEPLFTLDII